MKFWKHIRARWVWLVIAAPMPFLWYWSLWHWTHVSLFKHWSISNQAGQIKFEFDNLSPSSSWSMVTGDLTHTHLGGGGFTLFPTIQSGFSQWWEGSASDWVLGIPHWMFFVVAAFMAIRCWRRDLLAARVRRIGLCPHCQYDRAGLAADAACPECGKLRDAQP